MDKFNIKITEHDDPNFNYLIETFRHGKRYDLLRMADKEEMEALIDAIDAALVDPERDEAEFEVFAIKLRKRLLQSLTKADLVKELCSRSEGGQNEQI